MIQKQFLSVSSNLATDRHNTSLLFVFTNLKYTSSFHRKKLHPFRFYIVPYEFEFCDRILVDNNCSIQINSM